MKKFHFIGIKGSGMSALAQVLHDLGHYVQGSDVSEVFFTQKPLEQRGIKLFTFNEQNIDESFTIIAGNAFKEDNVEIKTCIEKNISFMRYHEFLKAFMENYITIGVSGAHGKTSTTGLLAHALKSVAPTSYLIGDGTGSGEGDSTHFVLEACEYRRHFLAYHPDYAIITNVDFDHPDYFSGIEDVKDAFLSFSGQTKKAVFACGDDTHIQKMNFPKPVVTYGLSSANDLVGKNISTNENGTTFEVFYKGESLGYYQIPMFGTHHVLNTLAVIGVCLFEKVDMEKVKAALLTYGGVKRRFTETKLKDNVLIDDYAHHPTEIKATLESVRAKYKGKNVVAIFQPHTFSRTKAFLGDFAKSLEGADETYLVDIFSSAREQSGELTIYDLISLTKNAKHLNEHSISQLDTYQNSVLVFMGAGDIQKVQKLYETRKTNA